MAISSCLLHETCQWRRRGCSRGSRRFRRAWSGARNEGSFGNQPVLQRIGEGRFGTAQGHSPRTVESCENARRALLPRPFGRACNRRTAWAAAGFRDNLSRWKAGRPECASFPSVIGRRVACGRHSRRDTFENDREAEQPEREVEPQDAGRAAGRRRVLRDAEE